MLRAILLTAVDDELLLRNPCRIPGAGEPRSAERPTLSVTELAALAAVVSARYRAVVLMAGFSGLRAGELAALRIRDLGLDGGHPEVRVTRRLYRVAGRLTLDAPKSEAGGRTVALPAFVAGELRRHLDEHRPGAAPDDLVFLTAGGREILDTYSQILRRGLDKIGRTDCRGHDLRHSAMTAAAEHGATLATPMQMAGHSTPAAAQRYQHATAEHSRRVAVATGVGGHVLRQHRRGLFRRDPRPLPAQSWSWPRSSPTSGRQRATLRSGSVPAGWRHRRTAVEVALDRGYRLFDVDDLDRHQVLRGELALGLAALGYGDLDAELIRGPDRRVTRLVANWAYQQVAS